MIGMGPIIYRAGGLDWLLEGILALLKRTGRGEIASLWPP